MILEKVSISEDANTLTNFILDNLQKLPNTFTKNLPSLSFKLRKIIIDFNTEPNTDTTFDLEKSKISGILYFHFRKDAITKQLIQHECAHAINFMKGGLNKTLNFLKKLTNLYKSNKNNILVFEDFILLFYYSSNDEISAIVNEFYRKTDSYINKSNFYEVLKNSEQFHIAKRLKNINLHDLFINIDIDLLEDFFSTFYDYEIKKKNILDIIKNFFIGNKKSKRKIELDIVLNKYQKYFNTQGEYMIKKLSRLFSIVP